MEAVGSRCDLHLYEGQPHGFFNQRKSKTHYAKTVFEMDRFLGALGYLKGEPTIQMP
jgi:dienelactone hydrolase